MSEKAKTYDEGKEPLAWLPWAAIDDMSNVQAYGYAKYKDFNNYRKGMEVSRNLSCALRHIRDYMNGEDVDHESGHNPLAHAMCRIAFVLQNLADGVAIDDRYKPVSKETEVEMIKRINKEWELNHLHDLEKLNSAPKVERVPPYYISNYYDPKTETFGPIPKPRPDGDDYGFEYGPKAPTHNT